MKISTLLLSPAAMALSASAAGQHEQCFGFTPMPSVSTYLGSDLNYATAERICCNNHRWAEYRGYLEAPEVDFFGRLDPAVETVFYDSVCGIPLFIAPRGRTFEEFKEESLHHGWPSFRPEELVSENVIIHDDGRMESRCLTHLGHNLPSGGVDRYCIDLVCMAGEPLAEDDERAGILALLSESVIDNTEFDAFTYESSAEEYSGKHSKLPTTAIVVVSSIIACALLYYFGVRPAMKRRREYRQPKNEVVQQGTTDSVDNDLAGVE